MPAFGMGHAYAKAFLDKHGGSYVHALHDVYSSSNMLNKVNLSAPEVHSAMNEVATGAGLDQMDQLHLEFGSPPEGMLNYATNHPEENPKVDLSKIDPMLQTPFLDQGHGQKLADELDIMTHEGAPNPIDLAAAKAGGKLPEPAPWFKKLLADADEEAANDPWESNYPLFKPIIETGNADIYYPSNRHALYHSKDFYESTSRPERNAAETYAASSFTLNTDLRMKAGQVDPTGMPDWRPVPESKRAIVDKRTVLLDTLIQKAPKVAKPTVVYRGVGSDFWKNRLYHLQEGDLLSDAGYVSTSLDQKTASDFANHWDSGFTATSGAVLEIVLEPGTSAFAMGPFGHGSEQEVLLPRNSVFKILKVDRAKRRITAAVVRETDPEREGPLRPSPPGT